MAGRLGRRSLAVLCVLLAAAAPGLSGCWDHRELEQTAFVLTLGIDQGDEKSLKLTSLIAIPQEAGAGGGGAKTQIMPTSVEADNIADAMNIMNAYVDRPVSFVQTKAIVWGEEAARQNLTGHLDTLRRMNEFRRDSLVLVVRGQTAEKFLTGLTPILESDPARYLEMLPLIMPQSGMIPQVSTMHSLILEMEQSGIAPYIYLAAPRPDIEPKRGPSPDESGNGGGKGGAGPLWPGSLPRTGGPNAEVIGAAVMSKGHMVGAASGDEVRVMNMLRGDFEQGSYSAAQAMQSVEAPRLILRRDRRPQIRVSAAGGRPHVTVHIPLEAELLGAGAGADYTSPEGQQRLTAAVEADLKEQAETVIKKAQEEWQCDPFGFGLEARGQFRTQADWENYKWEERWPAAKVEISFSVKFRRFGIVMAPTKFDES